MQIDDLLKIPPFELTESDKEEIFVPQLKSSYRRHMNGCKAFYNFIEESNFELEQAKCIADFPPLPVTMFKEFKLHSVPEDKIVRELRSSGTTGSRTSRIFLDRVTLHRQTKALLSILKSYLGIERRPLLVFDLPPHPPPGGVTGTSNDFLSARGAAVRGFSNFASSISYGLRQNESTLNSDIEAIERFASAHRDQPVILFGFTYILWSVVRPDLEKAGLTLNLQQAILFHGGGWKKLRHQKVDRALFNQEMSRLIGCPPEAVLDYYGMVEQVGSIFVDCHHGNKHTPNFATVIIRDPLTFQPLTDGRDGLIEVVSLLPESYPGQAVLTEDIGRCVTIDNCPCGRKGMAFRFTSRVERTELRGCGDIWGQALQR